MSHLRPTEARLVPAAAKSKTIVAGYLWFTDWGRDTFIALRGLCLATDRLADTPDILLAWGPLGDAGVCRSSGVVPA